MNSIRTIVLIGAGNVSTATDAGISAKMLYAMQSASPPPELAASLAHLVQGLAMARALNDAWALMAAITFLASLALLIVRPVHGAPQFR